MKNTLYTIFIITIIILIAQETVGQTISLGADSSNQIMHDSTGYVEIHPMDIPDSRGLFIFSKDGTKAVRIFGSFRMLYNVDNRQQFQAFQIDPPTLPTGEDDFKNLHSNWTPNMSRLGLDAMVGTGNGKGFLIRFELDWKGTDEAFRIRHMFMRTRHWILGKTWTSFTALPYLPQTVGGHMTGAASGVRVPQIRYYNSSGNWKYQASLEYQKGSLIKPDTLNAESQVLLPAMAARFSYAGKWGQAGAALLLKPNKMQFTVNENEVQSVTGYGANIGTKFNIGQRNRLKFGGYYGSGIGSYIVDFAYVDIESIYNPQTIEFESMNLYGGFMAFVHDWSKTFSSTLAGAYNNVDNKTYQDDLAFNYSYKGMVNLFYKPARKMNSLVAGAEFLYAERFNKNSSQNSALRFSLLVYYDF